ncbi:Major facilitator superfamily MFS_1 [Oleidesulfovibrio alaskensis]
MLYTVAATQFIMPFMFSGVAVTLPVMGQEFGAGGTALGLVESIYLAATGALLLPLGRLADMAGHAPLFRSGVLLYAVSTLLLSFTQDMTTFILLRLVQGTGAAMTMASNMALLTKAIPRSERGRAMGIAVASVYLGLSAGPFLGGAIATHLGWRWLYILGTPPLALAYLLARRNLKERWQPVTEPFDWAGAALSVCAVGLAVFGGPRLAAGPGGILALAGSMVCGALFLVVESRTANPLLDLALLRRNKTFSFATAAQFINYAATFGITFLFSLYLQNARGMTAQETGTVLLVQPLVQTLLSPLCGRLADSMPAHRIATAGMACCTAGTLMAAMTGADTSMAFMLTMFVVLGVGFALFASPNMSIIMGSVQTGRYGIASAMAASMRTLGMVLSMVLVTAAMSLHTGDAVVTAENADAFISAMRWSFAVFSALGGFGVALSLFASLSPDAPRE